MPMLILWHVRLHVIKNSKRLFQVHSKTLRNLQQKNANYHLTTRLKKTSVQTQQVAYWMKVIASIS